MNENLLKRADIGHAIFVVFVIIFHVWFLIDVWGVSSRIEHLMFVMPLAFVAFALGAFILISLLGNDINQKPRKRNHNLKTVRSCKICCCK